MKKLLTILIASVFAIVGVSPTQAAEFKVIAVIDTGFDVELLGDSVIEEVCIVATSIGCNGTRGLRVGPGSAGSPVQISSSQLRDWNHGTQMAESILTVDPNIKLVLIRNSRIFGKRVYAGTEKDLERALDWVEENADAYNISAVSFSRGSHAYANSSSTNRLKTLVRLYTQMHDRLVSRGASQRLIDYYAKKIAGWQSQLDSAGPVACKVSASVSDSITSLKNDNIATFIAVGNDGDKVNVDSPACVDDAVSVATLAKYSNDDGSYNLANNSNASANTDFASSGNIQTSFGFERDSSSVATAVLAAYWVTQFDGSFDSTYQLLLSQSSGISGYNIPGIDVLK